MPNRSPTRNRKQRASEQVYMYFSTENTTPLWHVSSEQKIAQTMHLNYGHLIQVKPLTESWKQPDSHHVYMYNSAENTYAALTPAWYIMFESTTLSSSFHWSLHH